jgi:hypothetical protein
MNRAPYTRSVVALAAALAILALGCKPSPAANHGQATHAEVTSEGREGGGTRARLERARKIDFLGQLYLGESLPPRDLAALGALAAADGRGTAAVVDALAERPEFTARFQARLTAFAAGSGDDADLGASPEASSPLDGASPDAPLGDTLARLPGLGGDTGVCPTGDLAGLSACFVDWFTLEASPGAAAPSDPASSTYKGLLDAYARASGALE